MSVAGKGDIRIYRSEDGKARLDVLLEEETVWLTLEQMVRLFDSSKQNISYHIRRIFREGELEKEATVKKSLTVQKEGEREVSRNKLHYNLDVIISVGYRVRSLRGTQFRIWANQVLKEHIIQGYTLNEKRLREDRERKLDHLKKNVELLERTALEEGLRSDDTVSLIRLVKDYAYGLDLLDKYDHGKLEAPDNIDTEVQELGTKEAWEAIERLKESYSSNSVFGREKKEGALESTLLCIYQTFDRAPLYPSLEEKAANLLYLIVKDHPFVDGNKRIAAYLFLVFLDINERLYQKDGSRSIANNALVPLTLMVAQSHPDEKDPMVHLIMNLLSPEK